MNNAIRAPLGFLIFGAQSMAEKEMTTIHGVARTEMFTVWCGNCGSWFAGEATRILDGDSESEKLAQFCSSGFSALNTVSCGSCGWSYVIEEWLAISMPSTEKMFLVVPETHRHVLRTYDKTSFRNDPNSGGRDSAVCN